jgi:hypothetical protein
MRMRSVERCTRLVGVALLFTGGFSTGLQHAHSGGSTPHDHHARGTAAVDVQEPASDTASWMAAPLHMHFFLLGFQFTLPTQEESNSEPTPGEHMLVVRLMGDDLTDSAIRLPADTGNAPLLAAPASMSLAPALPIVVTCNWQHASPLCDLARHERSGVLRA